MALKVTIVDILTDTSASGLSAMITKAIAKKWEMYGMLQTCEYNGGTRYTQMMCKKVDDGN